MEPHIHVGLVEIGVIFAGVLLAGTLWRLGAIALGDRPISRAMLLAY